MEQVTKTHGGYLADSKQIMALGGQTRADGLMVPCGRLID